MKFDDDFALALPRRRDDEPPELRAQIVKEIRDHLECAYLRELLRTADEALAIRRVQEQFGDPRQLARKLWFAAMQEKIMSQRILVGVSAFLAIACVTIGGFALRIAQQTTEASAAASKALVEQGRETNQALLRALERLAPSQPRPIVANTDGLAMPTSEIRLKLVKGQAGGPPAAGYQICVSDIQQTEVEYNRAEYNGVSDANGEFAAAGVYSGSCSVLVTTPWGEEASFNVEVTADGAAEPREIVCPDEPPAEFSLTLDVEWPDDLREKNLGLLLRCPTTRRLDGTTWSQVAHSGDEAAVIIVTSDGLILRNIHGFVKNRVDTNGLHMIAFREANAVPGNTVKCKGTSGRLDVTGVVILGWGGEHYTLVPMAADSPEAGERAVPASVDRDQITAEAPDTVDSATLSVPPPANQSNSRVSIAIPPETAAKVRRALGLAFNPTGGARQTPRRDVSDEKPDVAEIDENIDYFTSAIQNRPKEAQLYRDRGLSWRDKGNFAKAVEDLSQAILLDPRNRTYYRHRGELWSVMCEFDKAIDDFAKVIELDPKDQWAHDRRMEIWVKKGELQKAIDEYGELIQYNRDDADLYVARGRLSQRQHSLENALQDYLEALTRAPDSATTKANLAWFLATVPDAKFRNGKRSLKLAVEACRIADWREWDALNALAAAHAESGDFELAADWQAKCLEMAKTGVFVRTDEDIKRAETRLAEYQAGKPWRDVE